MVKTRLSSKGQVIIPKSVRSAHRWETGQVLLVIDTADGIVLQAPAPFKKTVLKDVSGCLKYHGPAKSLQDMENAIKKGARERKQ